MNNNSTYNQSAQDENFEPILISYNIEIEEREYNTHFTLQENEYTKGRKFFTYINKCRTEFIKSGHDVYSIIFPCKEIVIMYSMPGFNFANMSGLYEDPTYMGNIYGLKVYVSQKLQGNNFFLSNCNPIRNRHIISYLRKQKLERVLYGKKVENGLGQVDSTRLQPDRVRYNSTESTKKIDETVKIDKDIETIVTSYTKTAIKKTSIIFLIKQKVLSLYSKINIFI